VADEAVLNEVVHLKNLTVKHLFILNMVWLYRSSNALWKRESFTCRHFFYLPSRRLQEGEGGDITLKIIKGDFLNFSVLSSTLLHMPLL
jgi:hypothetical protein